MAYRKSGEVQIKLGPSEDKAERMADGDDRYTFPALARRGKKPWRKVATVTARLNHELHVSSYVIDYDADLVPVPMLSRVVHVQSSEGPRGPWPGKPRSHGTVKARQEIKWRVSRELAAAAAAGRV